jgi:hypothetical protein
MRRAGLLLFFGLLCAVFAQENRVVLVGVPLMKNAATRSVPANLERDRLVTYLNQQKPDKKQHLAVQGVPLDGTTADEVAEEAKQKKCDFVVYTTLLELSTSSDPYQRTPGTIQTNPGGVWNNPGNPRAQAMEPEYRATVEYKLYRADGTPVSGAPFTNQQATMETEVVAQVMGRIASKVFAEVKKGGAPPMQE